MQVAITDALEKATGDEQFALFNAPDEWSGFSVLLDGKANQWESHLAIDGMHCAACAINIEKTVNAINGVESVTVNATSGRARITWFSDQVKPATWMQAISAAGYGVVPAADGLMQDDRKKSQRVMLWRWLVAGFCMMQVMMYTLPIYYASPGEMTADSVTLLRWAAWVLTLPVVFFSCGPFFKQALNDLKHRQISMDFPVALGILITFCVSTAATFEPAGWWGSEIYFDSLTMLVFFLLTGRWIALRMHDKTAGTLDVLMRRLPTSVKRLKADGQFESVAVRQLNLGDEVQVLPGEAFPADGVITLGSTSANESLLTGESRPVSKALGAKVIAGSYNLASAVQFKVHKLGQETRYAKIVAMMERAAVDKPRLALLADRIARPFLILVLLAAAGSALYLWQVDHSRALMTAVAVLIVTCPCALSLATPAAMLTSAGVLAKSGVLVRKMQALEALTTIDTIVFDKTGTLTSGHMIVGKITTDKSMTTEKALAIAGAMAQHSLHPLSRALLKASTPSAKRLVSHVEEVSGSGLTARCDDGQLKLGSAAFCALTDKSVSKHAGSVVYLASEAGWLATFEMEESVKPDAVDTMATLAQQGFQLEVLSGDQPSSVEAVAKAVGINRFFAQCKPQEKLAHIQLLASQGKQVLMVGDGLNDGPVLASAHVSMAMGEAAPLAQAQSDFIITGGQLTMVSHLIQQAKRTMHIVRQNLMWAAVYNAVCVPLAIAGYLPAWLAGLGMAFSSLFVVLNAARLSREPAGRSGLVSEAVPSQPLVDQEQPQLETT